MPAPPAPAPPPPPTKQLLVHVGLLDRAELHGRREARGRLRGASAPPPFAQSAAPTACRRSSPLARSLARSPRVAPPGAARQDRQRPHHHRGGPRAPPAGAGGCVGRREGAKKGAGQFCFGGWMREGCRAALGSTRRTVSNLERRRGCVRRDTGRRRAGVRHGAALRRVASLPPATGGRDPPPKGGLGWQRPLPAQTRKRGRAGGSNRGRDRRAADARARACAKRKTRSQ